MIQAMHHKDRAPRKFPCGRAVHVKLQLSARLKRAQKRNQVRLIVVGESDAEAGVVEINGGT